MEGTPINGNGNFHSTAIETDDKEIAAYETSNDPALKFNPIPVEKNCIETTNAKTSLVSESSPAAVLPNLARQTLLCKVHVPLIENTIDFEHHKDYLNRFFTLRYCIDFNQKYNDFCVLVHSNKVCVVTLAPSHPLIHDDIEVKRVNFQVSKNINRLDNKISGKHKRHAQNLNQSAPLCFVECAGDKVYTIYSTVPGKLLEMNDQLENNPKMIRECSPAFYHKQCYVAIILPSIHHTLQSLNKNFLTPEEYEKAIEHRVTSKNVEC